MRDKLQASTGDRRQTDIEKKMNKQKQRREEHIKNGITKKYRTQEH
jgi:hypothetical protein